MEFKVFIVLSFFLSVYESAQGKHIVDVPTTEGNVVVRKRRDLSFIMGETSPSAFTDAQIKAVLDAHNNHRADQGGSNIQKIKWSSLLADMGQAAAEFCVFSHFNRKYNETTEFGQNIAMFNYDVNDELEKVVDAWYKEVDYYDMSSNNCQAGKMCGHYLQMVLAPVTKLGCGIHKCDVVEMPDKDWTDSYVIFCNYDRIRMSGELPFKVGAACGECKISPGWKCVNKLCEKCDPATDDSCNAYNCWSELSDKFPAAKCELFKKMGYCQLKSHVMSIACPQTCQLCPN